ncbi:tether containing UBX domain for GLUT4, partial [Clonorchis sinensis]
MNLEATNPAELGVLRGSALLQLQRFPPGHPIPPTPAAPVSGVAKTAEPVETQSDGGDDVNPTEMALETPPPDSNDQDCLEHVTMPLLKPEGTSDVHFETEFVSPYSVFAERPTQSVFGQPEECDVDHQTQNEPETLGALLGISLEPGMEPMGTTSQGEPNVQFDQFKFPEETAGVDMRIQSSDDDMYSVNLNVDRECIAFRLAPTTQITSTEDVPDEFFELTEADLRNIIQAYRNEWASNQPLQTAAMRKSAREQLYRKYPRAIIQFHWSDGVVLQACFHPREHVSELYHFIQENMRCPQTTELQLYTTPPKTFLKDKDETLIEANLVPMTKVYISPQSLKAEEALRPELISDATTANMHSAREVVANWMQPLTSQSAQSQTGRTTTTRAPVTSNSGPETCSLQPKWLKLGK